MLERCSNRRCGRGIFVVLLLLLTLTGIAAEEGFTFRFSYFPSYNAIRYLILSPSAEMTRWKITLTSEVGTRVLAQQQGKLPAKDIGETMTIPKLSEGSYRLTVTLSGNGKTQQVACTFKRQSFPWEHTTLGKDPIVVPPFTPLIVDAKARTVDCVLRRYKVGSAGFWDQVTSEDRPLLKAPISLRVTTQGRTYTANGRGFRFSKQQPTQVLGNAAWSAGPVRGMTAVDYDYDGMVKVTMQVQPSRVSIDALDLVIPLEANETWLMHPVTDELREHYAGKIPAGEGKVWDSVNIPRSKLPAPFVPYIWVGGPERGICWFANNDKDWVTDPRKPAMEITRNGDTVNLIVHFINKPGTITRQRILVFGLQASPAKPLPEAPYNYRRWWMQNTSSDTGVHFALMGANLYWGGNTTFCQYYPSNKDFSIWNKLREMRRTGKYNQQYADDWAKQYTPPLYSPEDQHTMLMHIQAGLGMSAGNPLNTPATRKYNYLIPYLNARGINWAEEAETYLDEWSMYDIADPRWEQDVVKATNLRFTRERAATYTPLSAIWYETDPVGSKVDMMLYYHQKMLQTFADGIYWDNFFFKANYNTVPGPGYVGDDGKLHAGVCLFEFRDLVKRYMTMQYKMGMRPICYIHMTNVNIIPMLSFGAINLDWEWRDQGNYATMDLQDRLGVDEDTGLILAMSTGLQSGNISVGIDRFRPTDNDPVKRAWLLRTMLAVCMTHEMKPESYEVAWAADLLDKFGYGQQDCKVYRYWEPGQPIKTSGANVKTLVLSRGKQALVVVGSYGADGDCTITLDREKLGLPADAQAINDETNVAITRTAPGVFVFPIKKHDIQFVLVR